MSVINGSETQVENKETEMYRKHCQPKRIKPEHNTADLYHGQESSKTSTVTDYDVTGNMFMFKLLLLHPQQVLTKKTH